MGAGFYLHRQNYVTPQGKTMLALIAQQVTIPAFLFAKIIFCPSDHGDGSGGGSDAPEFVCPSVADRIDDGIENSPQNMVETKLFGRAT